MQWQHWGFPLVAEKQNKTILFRRGRLMSSKKITKYDLVEAVYLNTKAEKKLVQEIVENLLLQLKESFHLLSFRFLI